MNLLKAEASVPVRLADTILREVEEIYNRITRRANEFFVARGGDYTLEIEDWLTAEREVVVKPQAEMHRTTDRLEVSVDVGALDTRYIEVVLTPHSILVWSRPESTGPSCFRILNPHANVLPGSMEARLEDDRLILTATLM